MGLVVVPLSGCFAMGESCEHNSVGFSKQQWPSVDGTSGISLKKPLTDGFR
jgi:hypothetical protein